MYLIESNQIHSHQREAVRIFTPRKMKGGKKNKVKSEMQFELRLEGCNREC